MKFKLLDLVIDPGIINPSNNTPEVIPVDPGLNVYWLLAGITVGIGIIVFFALKTIKKIKMDSVQ